MSLKFFRDFVCVFFWCQYVHNYNYDETKKSGIIWPFVLTTSLIGIFFHGIYMFVKSFESSPDQLSFWAPYTISWLLAAYLTHIICLKGMGFKQGESYFDSVEKCARRSAALSFSFLFTAVCFSSRILYFLIGAFGVFRA
ncbi:hypothetical protein ACEPNQ_001642 [Vibrio parahaemolyticus]|nr:hypothetical protein [Vibrio parahaemolyticus]